MKINELEVAEQVKGGYAVPIWEEQDGDGGTLSVEVHHAGFLISLRGEDLEPRENNSGLAATETYLTLEMLEGMKIAMKKFEHLID